MGEQAWFNFVTNRGDIIGQIEGVNAVTVEDLLPKLRSEKFITVTHPVSPKAVPRILKVCKECNAAEPLSDEEEDQVQHGAQSKCNSCGSSNLTAYPDEKNLKVTYTSLTTLVDGSKILIGTNQISRIERVTSPGDIAKIQQELYAEVEASGSI